MLVLAIFKKFPKPQKLSSVETSRRVGEHLFVLINMYLLVHKNTHKNKTKNRRITFYVVRLFVCFVVRLAFLFC